MSFRSRDVIGRKIVAVDLRRFHTGHTHPQMMWSFDPVFILDNGAEIKFSVDEVEDGSGYGITPILVKRIKRREP